jgi:hypothetical protein
MTVRLLAMALHASFSPGRPRHDLVVRGALGASTALAIGSAGVVLVARADLTTTVAPTVLLVLVCFAASCASGAATLALEAGLDDRAPFMEWVRTQPISALRAVALDRAPIVVILALVHLALAPPLATFLHRSTGTAVGTACVAAVFVLAGGAVQVALVRSTGSRLAHQARIGTYEGTIVMAGAAALLLTGGAAVRRAATHGAANTFGPLVAPMVWPCIARSLLYDELGWLCIGGALVVLEAGILLRSDIRRAERHAPFDDVRIDRSRSLQHRPLLQVMATRTWRHRRSRASLSGGSAAIAGLMFAASRSDDAYPVVGLGALATAFLLASLAVDARAVQGLRPVEALVWPVGAKVWARTWILGTTFAALLIAAGASAGLALAGGGLGSVPRGLALGMVGHATGSALGSARPPGRGEVGAELAAVASTAGLLMVLGAVAEDHAPALAVVVGALTSSALLATSYAIERQRQQEQSTA